MIPFGAGIAALFFFNPKAQGRTMNDPVLTILEALAQALIHDANPLDATLRLDNVRGALAPPRSGISPRRRAHVIWADFTDPKIGYGTEQAALGELLAWAQDARIHNGRFVAVEKLHDLLAAELLRRVNAQENAP